ncbi:hypothetical protein WMF37_40905 [Sorangium sp. So ce291]|uniref:hypothetical protein n=1 Tax=Sorangium sp. So ce291 TaxID=3133294 RepID=UPI003F60B8DB
MSKRTVSGIAIAVAMCALAILIALRRSGSPAPEKDEASSAAEESAPLSQPVEAVPPPPAPATIAKRAAPSSPALSTEAKLMANLRHARSSGQLELAIQLAREGNRRFPDSDSAPERASILIHSLADNEQRSEARGEAEYMVNHYPDSEWVREVEQFTGAHRHRNVRVNDAGELEYH